MRSDEMIWLEKDMYMLNLVEFSSFSVDYIVILPGAIEDKIVHFECDEWLYIISGELEVFIDGKMRSVKKGDSVRIPSGTIHGSKNKSSKNVDILSVCSPPFKLEYMNRAD